MVTFLFNFVIKYLNMSLFLILFNLLSLTRTQSQVSKNTPVSPKPGFTALPFLKLSGLTGRP